MHKPNCTQPPAAGWQALGPRPPLQPAVSAALAALLDECEPPAEVRYVDVDSAGEGLPVIRVWVTDVTAPVQHLLNEVQAAHRSLVIIAMRLPSGSCDPPKASPAGLVYVRRSRDDPNGAPQAPAKGR